MRRKTMMLVTLTVTPLSGACYRELVSADGGALSVVAGDGQLGVVGSRLPIPLRIRVTDQDHLPVADRNVTFTVDVGSGSVSPQTLRTGPDGEAETLWTLGAVVGDQHVRALVDNLPVVNFRATAAFTLFDIDVRFLSTPTEAHRRAFEAAATRWRRAVTGELSDVTVNASEGQCGANAPAINETIDDLIILVTLDQIDGPAGSLGQAGPCFIRTSNSLPLIGQMQLDVADLNALEQAGNLNDVILHEMGHVLGIGTLWLERNLLVDPVELGGTDPHFTGTNAIAAFDVAGGATYRDGQKVPVENTGGDGTADGHWRESVFRDELMTGFLNVQQPNPLSDVTIASLRDIGYDVSNTAGDAYTVRLQAGASITTAPSTQLREALYRGPIFMVGSDGRLVPVTGAR